MISPNRVLTSATIFGSILPPLASPAAGSHAEHVDLSGDRQVEVTQHLLVEIEPEAPRGDLARLTAQIGPVRGEPGEEPEGDGLSVVVEDRGNAHLARPGKDGVERS